MATKKKTTTPKKKTVEEQPFISTRGNIDSKFRFVHLASKRAKSLLKGAKPKIRAKSKNPIRLAQLEVKEGLVDFRVLPFSVEETFEREDRSFLGGDGVSISESEPESEEIPDGSAEDEIREEEDEEKEEELDAELPEEFDETDKDGS